MILIHLKIFKIKSFEFNSKLFILNYKNSNQSNFLFSVLLVKSYMICEAMKIEE